MSDLADHDAVFSRISKLLNLEDADDIRPGHRHEAYFGRYYAFVAGGSYIYIVEATSSSSDVIWHNDSCEPVDQEMLAALKRHFVLDELADV